MPTRSRPPIRLRTFWDAALALDPSAPDEGLVMRFQDAEELRELWSAAGLLDVETAPLDIAVEYVSFEDYWLPFEGGAAPGGRGAAPAMPAPVENRLYFADYRETDGVQFPFRLRRAVGADTIEETTFDRFRINQKIDPRRFENRK